MAGGPLRVLIVEDEVTAAEVMATYVERIRGFEVAGQATSGADCLAQLAKGDVDVILLDIYLPDMSGLEVLRRIRAAGSTVDAIAVTRARDLSVVQAAVSFGAMQYLVKPFTFAAVRQKLERYQAYRAMLAENNLLLAQQEVDRLMHTLRDTAADDLPKGISSESLQAVVAALRQSSGAGGLSAAEVATTAGASRVTARRYLEYLVTSGVAVRSARYRSAGRPEVEYRLVPRNHHGHPAN
jgi:response regulator of citrate/malate metabolism